MAHPRPQRSLVNAHGSKLFMTQGALQRFCHVTFGCACCRSHLEPREELIGVLVLAHIGGFPVVVLERLPEALGHKVWPVAQRQVAKGSLTAHTENQSATTAPPTSGF